MTCGSGNRNSGKSPPPRSPPSKSALRQCLADLDLPRGLLSSVLESELSCDSHLWVIDNSSSMSVRDSHVGQGHSDGTITRKDGVTRWEELSVTVASYCKMASKCHMPTKFWLVNEPVSTPGGELAFPCMGLCWGRQEDVPGEMNLIRRVMTAERLDRHECRLSTLLRGLSESVAGEAPSLEARDRHVKVLICTQGTPTDRGERTDGTVRQSFERELCKLSKLPVKITIKLCTDDEWVVEAYNDMAARIDCVSVLDDYWNEAMEIYLHNPWLTYSIGLHRLREAGLAPEVVNCLDKRPLTLDEIHQLCQVLFVGEDGGDIPLPPYQPSEGSHLRRHSWVKVWQIFNVGIREKVEKEKPQWNPVKEKLTPWIDLDQLESNLREQFGDPFGGCPDNDQFRNTYSGGYSFHGDDIPERSHSSFQGDDIPERSYSEIPSRRKGGPARTAEPSGYSFRGDDIPERSHSSSYSFHGADIPSRQNKKSSKGPNRRRTYDEPPRYDEPSGDAGRQGPSEGRRTYAGPSGSGRQEASGGRKTHDEPCLGVGRQGRKSFGKDDGLTLSEVLQRWSHQPPSYKKMHSLRHLLVTVPRTFPPENKKVEPHEYFRKWKTLDKNAFKGGDNLEVLLKRAVRGAKFFLHPDKLPKDLTENQELLFKTIWNVLADQERATQERATI